MRLNMVLQYPRGGVKWQPITGSVHAWDVEFKTMQQGEVTRKRAGKEERERGLGL